MSAELLALKSELKTWENEFQNTYGRKPTPDDIRAQGLADKYIKWKALSKGQGAMKKATVPPTTSSQPDLPATPSRRTGTEPAEPTSIFKRTKSIIQDRDPEPVAAKVNPFSPPRRQVAASAFRPSMHKLVLPSPPLTGNSTADGFDPDDPDNPFSAAPPPSTTSSFASQPDSPVTQARKRLRGEDVEMEGVAVLSDKKRRLLSRSQSASQSSIWSRGGSAANALRPCLPGPSQRQDGGVMDEEVLGPSPVKKSTYKTLFADSPPAPPLASAPGKGMARTISLPLGMLVFGKKKCELPQQMEKNDEGRLPTPSSGKRKRSGSGTGTGTGVEVVDDRSLGSIAGLGGLLPPSPPPTNENQRQQQQQLWKGKGKAATGRRRKKARIVSEGTSGEEEEEDAVEELVWKPVGPLKRRSHSHTPDAGVLDAEPDLELEGPNIARSKAKLGIAAEPEQEEGEFEIDLPDRLKEFLALAPPKRSREDEETIVRNLLAGKGDILPKVEIWAAGEVPENHGGDDDDDDWDGEPVGWWEAEL